jgi:hypothetical protein
MRLGALFVEFVPVTPEHEEWCVNISYPDVFFVEFIPVLLEHENLCIDISQPGCNRMHYMTHRSQWMQKHKFGIACPSVLFVEFVPVLPEHEK